MDRARILLLPRSAPARKAFDRSADRPGTWAGAARNIVSKLDDGTGNRLAEITEVDWPCAASELEEVAAARKKTARHYRDKIVRPMINAYDAAWFENHQGPRAIDETLPAWDYAALQEGVHCPGELLEEADLGPGDWVNYRLWAAVRSSQMHPHPVWGLGQGKARVPECPLCGPKEVDVRHVVMACDGTSEAWRKATKGQGRPPRPWETNEAEIWVTLMELPETADMLLERVRVVGECYRVFFHASRQ